MDGGPTADVVTLLIVEQTAAMCRLIRSVVAEVPAVVTECGGGRDAVASCDAPHPDWVLIDVDLGGPDALAIVGEIRLAYPAIRIVALGEDGPRLQEAALRAGARAYLAKEQLVLLKRLLRGELA